MFLKTYTGAIAAMSIVLALSGPVHAQQILDSEPGPGKLKTGECVLVKPTRGNCPKAYEVCGVSSPTEPRVRKCRYDIK
jgi:hypothetical protein